MILSTRSRLIASVLVLAWLFVVLLNYYVVHKPFAFENLAAVGDTLLSLFTACLMFALAASLGTRLLRTVDFDSRLEALVFRTGAGFVLISFTAFALGLAGLLNSLLFWILLVVALVLLRNDLRRNLSDVHWGGLFDSRLDNFLAAFVALTLLCAFAVALTPPIEWDAQLYHLLEGKFALAQGEIAPPPDIPTFNYPSLVEMIYLAALTLKGDIVARLIHWSFGVLTLGAVWAFARRYWNTSVAWLACAILAAIPTFITVMSWAYSDAILALFSFGAFYALQLGKEKNSARWFVLAGVFAGGALGTKNTAVIIPIALALLTLRLNRRAVARTAVMLCAAFLMAAPWYARNLLWVGNPIYPYFIGGKYWDTFRAAWGSRWGTGFWQEPLRLLTVPWEATIIGQEGTFAYSATLGPLMLALLPLLLLPSQYESARSRQVFRDALFFSLVGYLFWLTGIAASKLLVQSRYLIPIFPTLALSSGVAFSRLGVLNLRNFSAARFGMWVVGLVLALTLIAQYLGAVELNPFPYLAGFESRSEYLSRRISPRGYYETMQTLANLPPGSRVLFLWEARSYYAPDPTTVQPDQLFDTFADLEFRFKDAESIAGFLRQEGFTHLLLGRAMLDQILDSGYDPIGENDLQTLQRLLARFAPMNGSGVLDLYQKDGRWRIVKAEEEPFTLYEVR